MTQVCLVQQFATISFCLKTCHILPGFNTSVADISTLQVNSEQNVKIIEKAQGTVLKYHLKSTTMFFIGIAAKQEKEKKKNCL